MIEVQRWLRQIGSSESDFVNDVTIFGDSLYLTGSTRGELPSGFEKGDVGFDAWLGRFDLTTGNSELLVQLGSDSLFNIPSDVANGVASIGNVFIVGETEGTFGNPQGGSDAFIAEYDSSGNIIQIEQLGTNEDDAIEDIVIVNDLIYVVGTTQGALEGSNPEGNKQVWVAEYNLSLERNWVRQFSINDNPLSEASGLVVEGNNVFVAGSTRDDQNDFDGWLARLDITSPQAAPIITTIESEDNQRDEVKDLTLDGAGNIFVAGETRGTVGSLGDADQNFGGIDGWLGKYTFNDGDLTISADWLTQVGTPEDEQVQAVITTPDDESDADNDDNIIIVGETEGVIDFDNRRDLSDPESLQAGFPQLETNRGSVDVFLAQFDSAGNGGNPENDPNPDPSGNQILPTVQIGTSSTDNAVAVAKDENNNIHPVGTTFGSFTTENGNERQSDVWLAKYAQLASPPLEQQFLLIDETPSPDEALRIPLEDNPSFSRKNFVRFQDSNLGFDINYDVSDNNENLSGLAVRVHFDSSKLNFNALEVDFPFVEVTSFTQNLQEDITPEQEQQISEGTLTAEEAGGWDDNPNTDQFINLTLLDTDANFPSQGGLPTFIGRANFTTDLSFFEGSTEINFTEIEAPDGYEVNPQNITVQARKYTYDIDGDNDLKASTDGILILRFLFGERGDELLEGDVIGTGAVRTTAEEIEDYLLRSGRAFDVDGDGEANALSDGVLINRFLLQFDENELIQGAIADDAVRQEAQAIEDFIQFFLLETSLPNDGGDQNQGGENLDGNADGNNDAVV